MFTLNDTDEDYIDPDKPPIDETPPAEEEKAPKEEEQAPKEPGVITTKAPEKPEDNLAAENARRRGHEDKLVQELANLKEETAALRAKLALDQDDSGETDEADPEPDKDEDPYNHQLWAMRQDQKELLAFMKEEKTKREGASKTELEKERQSTFIREVDEYVGTDIQAFEGANPGLAYEPAAAHVRDTYMELWQNVGLSENEAAGALANTIYALGTAARQRKASAAKAVYDLALKMGYRPVAEPPSDLAPAEKPGPSGEDKVEQIRKAQKLQGLGDKTPAKRNKLDDIGSMTAAQLAEMSDEDYLRLRNHPEYGPILDARNRQLG